MGIVFLLRLNPSTQSSLMYGNHINFCSNLQFVLVAANDVDNNEDGGE